MTYFNYARINLIIYYGGGFETAKIALCCLCNKYDVL